jgi:WD repeat-containing protein 7
MCKMLAIDLCSRGFDIWQSYVDVMGLLRSLFNLASHTKKDGITTLNVGSAARSAVLQITSTNTPLVMTSLSMDILHVTDVQQRKSLMQMLAFLIRKVGLMVTKLGTASPNQTLSSAPIGDSAKSSAFDRSGGKIP